MNNLIIIKLAYILITFKKNLFVPLIPEFFEDILIRFILINGDDAKQPESLNENATRP